MALQKISLPTISYVGALGCHGRVSHLASHSQNDDSPALDQKTVAYHRGAVSMSKAKAKDLKVLIMESSIRSKGTILTDGRTVSLKNFATNMHTSFKYLLPLRHLL
jgi:hypothetical protein